MKYIVTRDEIANLRENKIIGKGYEGTCYLMEDKLTVVKLFHGLDKSLQLYFEGVECPQIAFPKDILYDEETDRIAGYTMNYLKGDKLIQGFSLDLEISQLKKCYLDMRIIMLKLKDVYMYDNCLENMLYDAENNKINIIDTSRWKKEKDGQLESINGFNWQMMCALLRTIVWKSFKLRDKRLLELYRIYENSGQDYSLFIEFINELEMKVSDYKGKKLKTLGDFIIK